jgi:purine-nucleoside phosphorylase
MSLHIGAAVGEIAETVLISGDPLRIKHMASLFLDECVCFNEIRGMYGYTGFYKGKRVSMMGTGIGIPTTILYLNELATDYNVKNVIRVGTIGAMVPELELGDLILAKSASTDSNINRIEFNGLDYAPTADFELLSRALSAAKQYNLNTTVAQVFSTDSFYSSQPNRWQKWIEHGIVGVEMETAALYTLAAKHNMKALAILTVSDNILSGSNSSTNNRETALKDMFKIALETAE